MSKPDTMRLARAISLSGLCSRRDAEKHICDGHVTLNGVIHNMPNHNVSPQDEIIVMGKKIIFPQVSRMRLWRYYKPSGLVTTHKDEQKRVTVFDMIRKHNPHLPRLISIGRLDINSEGLLLLTDNGSFAENLMSPRTQIERRYRVRALGDFTDTMQKALEKGVRIDTIRYRPIKIVQEVTHVKSNGRNKWYRLSLYEGKNREIRKIFEHFNLRVNRLIRIGYGNIGITGLTSGQIREIPQTSVEKINTLYLDKAPRM